MLPFRSYANPICLIFGNNTSNLQQESNSFLTPLTLDIISTFTSTTIGLPPPTSIINHIWMAEARVYLPVTKTYVDWLRITDAISGVFSSTSTNHETRNLQPRDEKLLTNCQLCRKNNRKWSCYVMWQLSSACRGTISCRNDNF